jgi:parallel beta helix pectate lyase-like protein
MHRSPGEEAAATKESIRTMATLNVSNSSQLKSALSKAHGGDTIKLAGGSYGSLSVSQKFSGNVTIKSDGNARFGDVTLKGAANLTFDNVTFSGSANGLRAFTSSNLTVTNCDFRDLNFGATFIKVNGLKVTNNYATEMLYDAFRFGGVSGVTISGNTYQEKNSKPGLNHKDFIQFWTDGGAGVSKNVSITNNKFYSDDDSTHGIFMNGTKYGGGTFQNVYIANNYFKSSHTHGITVAHANDLEIRNNTLIKDGRYSPLINVTPDSMQVKIIGNTAPSVPNIGNSSWIVSGNKETGSGTHWTGGISGTPISNTATALSAEADDSFASDSSPDDSDVFRFSGTKLDKGTTKSVAAVDFTDGDTLIFAGYDKGTFRGVGDKAGTYVSIDSLADLKALDKASGDVSVSVNKKTDVLTIEIDQGAATHKIAIADMAHDFLGL